MSELIQLSRVINPKPSTDFLNSGSPMVGPSSRGMMLSTGMKLPASHPFLKPQFLSIVTGGVAACEVGLHHLADTKLSKDSLLEDPAYGAGRLFGFGKGSPRLPSERGIFELAEEYYQRGAISQLPSDLFDVNPILNLATGTYFKNLAGKLGRGIDILELGAGDRYQHLFSWTAAVGPGTIQNFVLSDFAEKGPEKSIARIKDTAKQIEQMAQGRSEVAAAINAMNLSKRSIKVQPTSDAVDCGGKYDVIYGTYFLDSIWRPGDRMFLKTTDKAGKEHWSYVRYRMRNLDPKGKGIDAMNIEYFPVPIGDISTKFFGAAVKNHMKGVRNGFVHLPAGTAEMIKQLADSSLNDGGVMIFGDNGCRYNGSQRYPYEVSGPVPYVPVNFKLLQSCLEAFGLDCEILDLKKWTEANWPSQHAGDEFNFVLGLQGTSLDQIASECEEVIRQNSANEFHNATLGYGHSMLIVKNPAKPEPTQPA